MPRPRLTVRNRLIAAFELTADDVRLIQSNAHAVWDECAYDIFQSIAEEKGKDINAVTVPRAIAIEIALDAGRLEERLGLGRPRCQLSEAGRRFMANHYDGEARKLMNLLMKETFGFARYGM